RAGADPVPAHAAEVRLGQAQRERPLRPRAAGSRGRAFRGVGAVLVQGRVVAAAGGLAACLDRSAAAGGSREAPGRPRSAAGGHGSAAGRRAGPSGRRGSTAGRGAATPVSRHPTSAGGGAGGPPGREATAGKLRRVAAVSGETMSLWETGTYGRRRRE